jgi:hypothetical protein
MIMTVNNHIKTTIEWEGRTIRLSYDPVSWGVIDLLEIRVDRNEPIPITETGYRSHFFGPIRPSLTADEIKDMVRQLVRRRRKIAKLDQG